MADKTVKDETVKKEKKPTQAQLAAEQQQKTEERLQKIEELLIAQAEHNKKMLRSSKARNVFMIVFVAAFVVLGIFFYGMLNKITVGIPALVDSANLLVNDASRDLEGVMAEINALDFDAMNKAMQGIGSIDYQAMNDSIQGLQKGVAAFQAFTEALSSPFAALR